MAESNLLSVKMFSSHPWGKFAACAWEICAGTMWLHVYILSELAYHAQCEILWEMTLHEGSCVLLCVCVRLKLWKVEKE